MATKIPSSKSRAENSVLQPPRVDPAYFSYLENSLQSQQRNKQRTRPLEDFPNCSSHVVVLIALMVSLLQVRYTLRLCKRDLSSPDGTTLIELTMQMVKKKCSIL